VALTSVPNVQRSPSGLLRTFVAGSLVAIVVMVALAGAGVYRIYYSHVIGHAEVNALQLSRTVLEQERDLLAAPPAAAQLAGLDERMRRHLKPLDMLKISVFAPDGRVLYSSDPATMGRNMSADPRFRAAMAGDADTRFVPDPSGGQLDLVESYVPIRDGDRIVGSLATCADVTWSRGEVATVVTLASLVVLCVLLGVFGFLFGIVRSTTRQMAAAQRDLETMAITDGLTGLANRRYLMARAADECARIPRQRARGAVKSGVGFIMADIDGFKSVNDTHGHLVGDDVLRAVAERIRRVTRRYDIVGRYGGDEFLVVVPDTDFDETRAVAERLWQIVREEPCTVAGEPRRVTVSVGFTCADDDVQAAIKRADEALYRAKHAGRDRIVAF
jgi:diguanylate cyclase (GGDEF)-like protein